MKEIHYFYVPDAESCGVLPDDEASHALRVLRLQSGDEIMLTNGKGSLFRARIAETTKKSCSYEIVETIAPEPIWSGKIHLAVAPTKSLDRMEWLVEKATEIGFDELTFLDCRFSERRNVKPERFERIVIAAAKQSHKACLPKVNAMVTFNQFMRQPPSGAKYIAHCLSNGILKADLKTEGNRFGMGRFLLSDILEKGDTTVMIGPEGDFSVEEVEQALKCGFVPISLGNSRLRTETAALYALFQINLKNSLHP